MRAIVVGGWFIGPFPREPPRCDFDVLKKRGDAREAWGKHPTSPQSATLGHRPQGMGENWPGKAGGPSGVGGRHPPPQMPAAVWGNTRGGLPR